MLGPRGNRVLTALLALSCGAAERDGSLDEVREKVLGRHASEPYVASLETVLERRHLRVLTSRNSFDYFIYQGQPGGYEYEMVRAFVDHLNRKYSEGPGELGIQLELLPVARDQLIPMLLEGRADMVAARLTVTPTRADRVRFSMPYRHVDEVIVTRRRPNDYRLPQHVSGETIAVRKGSRHYESLLQLNRRLEREGHAPVIVADVDEGLETEKILELVAAGRFDFTVADSLVAGAAVAIHSELSILRGLELRGGGDLAWATHPEAPGLLAEMNEFLPSYRHGSLLGNAGVNRYFSDHGGLRARLASDAAGLSPYDAYIRRYSAEFGFDWRLMAAVAYQESRFDQTSRGPTGAVGLFQIKPVTAREPYVGIPEIAGERNAANNVRAGIKYLAWIKGRYFDSIPEMRERDRVRMALAAYNAGPRTLLDARKRAQKMGLDPARWFRNVELALLAMNRPAPVKYVSEINQHYLSYIVLGVK